MKTWFFPIALVGVLFHAEAFAVPVGTFSSAAGDVKLAVEANKGTDKGLPLNKLVSLTIEVTSTLPESQDGVDEISFDARMPGHDHGMVVKPQVTRLGPTTFRVDGVKLHMAGAWELRFKVKDGPKTIDITAPYHL